MPASLIWLSDRSCQIYLVDSVAVIDLVVCGDIRDEVFSTDGCQPILPTMCCIWLVWMEDWFQTMAMLRVSRFAIPGT